METSPQMEGGNSTLGQGSGATGQAKASESQLAGPYPSFFAGPGSPAVGRRDADKLLVSAASLCSATSIPSAYPEPSYLKAAPCSSWLASCNERPLPVGWARVDRQFGVNSTQRHRTCKPEPAAQGTKRRAKWYLGNCPKLHLALSFSQGKSPEGTGS